MAATKGSPKAIQGFAVLIGFLISMVTMIVPLAITGLPVLAALAFLLYGLWTAFSIFKIRTFATRSSADGWNAI